jgi:hypothetical protein
MICQIPRGSHYVGWAGYSNCMVGRRTLLVKVQRRDSGSSWPPRLDTALGTPRSGRTLGQQKGAEYVLAEVPPSKVDEGCFPIRCTRPAVPVPDRGSRPYRARFCRTPPPFGGGNLDAGPTLRRTRLILTTLAADFVLEPLARFIKVLASMVTWRLSPFTHKVHPQGVLQLS